MHNFEIIIGLTALYFALILGFVVYARFKSTNSILPGLNEFFLAGKNLHPLVLVATFTASLFSTFSVLGMPALSYAHGIGALFFLGGCILIAQPFLIFVGMRMRRYAEGKRLFSPVEILSRSYNSRRLGLFIALVFSVFLMPYISLQLVGVGAFIEAYTQGEINYTLGVGSMMVIVLIYLFLGGMRAVAYTDFVQLIAMVLGLFLGIGLLFVTYDISVGGLLADIRDISPSHLSLPGPKEFYSPAMLATSALVLTGVFAQPHLLTRNLMAKNDREIKYMAIGSIIGTGLIVTLGMAYGLFAFKTYGGDLAPNQMMGHVFQDMASLGIFGLILSTFMLMGALGAAMSTADSLLISIGQITTRDMVRPFFKMTPAKQVLFSKGIMFFVLALAFLTGLKPPQFMTDLALYSAAGCALIMPTILCFGWKRRSTLAAYLSIILGLIFLGFTVSYKFTNGSAFGGVHPGAFPMATSFIVYFGICFLKQPKKH